MTFNNPKFLFGKYKGRAVRNVPRDYLEWYVTLEDTDPKYAAFKRSVVNTLQYWDSLSKKQATK